MNHHHHHRQPPQPPPPINHQTISQLLKQTTSIFFSNFLIFLFLSTIIFTFRSNVEHGAHYLTTFVDRDPSLKSLLSRIDLSAQHQIDPNLQLGNRRRRPFLHLSRVGTLDDDFFSGDSDLDRSLFHPSSKPQPNVTFSILSNFNPSSGFSQNIIDNGISLPQAIRSGFVSFKAPPESLNLSRVDNLGNGNDKDENGVVDLQFLIKGLELGGRDASALLFLVGILSASYGYVVLAFLVTYTWVHGIVFLQVVDYMLGNYRSTFRTMWDGSNLGLRRLSGFVLMRWAVRDALAQLLGIWIFGEIEDQYAFFKVFVRMKLMPFSDVAPWVTGHERQSLCFIISWFLVELVVGFIFAIDSWVSIVDSRKSGREVVKEGCHLLGVMLYPAIKIKCWEVMVCGWFASVLLGRIFGGMFALAFQSVMEVYFMVAWLTFYLAARYNDASSVGRTFGRRELEGFLEGMR